MADILVNVGFKVGSANPLDGKAKVQTIEERDALISEGLAYESLRTYVASEKKWYEYDGSTWNEITETGGSGGGSDVYALLPTTQIDDQIGRIWLENL